MILPVNQNPVCTKNSDSGYLQSYLDGFTVSNADHRQVKRIIAESNASKRLKYHFNNVDLSRNNQNYSIKLKMLFNVLESFVLVPIELENTAELAEEHLDIRLQSIEMLEEVLELIEG